MTTSRLAVVFSHDEDNNPKSNPPKWKRFRRKILNVNRLKNGVLTCWHCGKEDLNAKVGQLINQHNDASIDHLVPMSKGGKRYDVNNVVVSCFECNNTKGNLSLAEFRCTSYYIEKVLA